MFNPTESTPQIDPNALAGVAEQTGVTMAQAALAWPADRPMVTAPILGARTIGQMVESLAVADLHLDDDAAAILDEASALDLPDYPYGQKGIEQRSRKVEGGR